MSIAYLQLSLFIPGTQTLKDKRQVVQSMMKRLRNKFNLAVAEIDAQDLYQRTELGIVTINTSSHELQRTLDYVVSFVESNPDMQIMEVKVEYL